MTKQKLLLFFFILLFLIIIAKLFYLQVINPFSSASNDYLQTKKIEPERGKIYDRNGEPMVTNKRTYLLYIEPKKITDQLRFIAKLDSVLHMGEATLAAKFDNKKDWVAVKNGLEKADKDAIGKLNLPGIGFNDQFERYYSEASQAAHLLGFVGKTDVGDSVGYFGVEGYYQKDLTGLPGVSKSERDLFGQPIFLGTQELVNSENGRDLYLTIDKSVQEIAKRKLLTGLDTYKAKEGCVIIADPSNMQILALTCLPDFDTEHYYDFSEDYFRDPAISNFYEPGSIFKPLIMAAAIEEKAIKPDDFYDETGPVKIGNYTIRTWDNKYEGKISMTRILEKSSNVGMVWVGQHLGNNKLYSYLGKYGFGQTTGIDLQGEESGYIKPKSGWYPIDFSTLTFGQGIAVTPIQMIRAFASLINGGKLLQPYIVDKIDYQGNVKKNETKIIKQTISPLTSQIIVKMLISDVQNGEVKWDRPKGYTIGGKTGTAQVPIAGHYDPSKTIASFIGFAPANNPKFIALVMLKEPKASPWGSETAAPMFFNIAKELLVYYNIAPQ